LPLVICIAISRVVAIFFSPIKKEAARTLSLAAMENIDNQQIRPSMKEQALSILLSRNFAMAGSPMGLTSRARTIKAIPFCQYPIKNSTIAKITKTEVPSPITTDEIVVRKANVPRRSRMIIRKGIRVIRKIIFITAVSLS